MEQPLIYLIGVAVVLVIFIAGYAVSRLGASKTAAAFGANAGQVENAPRHRGVYEAPGVNQHSDHPLGAVQSVVRGRIRVVWFGLILFGVGVFGLYVLYLTDVDFYVERTTVNVVIATVILAGALIYGLRLGSLAFRRINLRRTGFELCSLFAVKVYEYKDVDFVLTHKIEHKAASVGYRPVLAKTQNFNFVWVCQVLFRDGRRPIELKSSRYAWLSTKMQAVIDALHR